VQPAGIGTVVLCFIELVLARRTLRSMQLRGLLLWDIRNGVMQCFLVSSLAAAPAAAAGFVFC